MFNFLLQRQMPERTQCATVPTADLSSCPTSLEHALEIEEKFALRVLDEGGGRRVSGKIARLAGRRLIAQVSEYLKPGTCVRIDLDDAIMLGVAAGCWREGPTTLVALELQQVLNGLEYWDSLQHLRTPACRRA